MRTRTSAIVALLLGAAFCAGAPGQDPDGAPAPVLLDPAKDTPGLKVGQSVPAASMTTTNGARLDLASMLAKGPVVVTFYRGGWCPYCTKALAQWGPMLDEFEAAGVSLLFVSPETAEHAATTGEKHAPGVTIACDADGAMAGAFRVAFAMPADLQTKYKGFGVDLATRNATGRWELPAPATFVIDRKGIVRWVFADWDYQKRADPNEVLAFVTANAADLKAQ